MLKMNIMLLTAIALLAGSQAFASGYEKTIMWGGRTAGVAGISAPFISGAQALYFNPAGIVTDRQGHEVAFQISPTYAQFKGPINSANEEVASTPQMTYPFGLIYSGQMSEQWAFAVGGFVSGGSRAVFENVNLGAGYPTTGEAKTDLSIIEFSAGAGYRPMKELKIGAGYRVSFATASFSFLQRAGAGQMANIKMTDLKDTNYTGFRLGAQYQIRPKTTLGLVYRSNVDFVAKGGLSAQVLAANGTTTNLAVTSTENSAATSFPQQVTLGAMQEYHQWRALAEYSWTNYAKVGSVQIKGAFTGQTDPVVQQQWKDQHNLRLAGEYLGTSWPVRFGYGWTSQVTNSDWARATFTPPAAAHTLTAGTGQIFPVGGRPLQFDAALELTALSASGGVHAAGAATTNANANADIRAGTYSATAIAVHTGVTYAF